MQPRPKLTVTCSRARASGSPRGSRARAWCPHGLSIPIRHVPVPNTGGSSTKVGAAGRGRSVSRGGYSRLERGVVQVKCPCRGVHAVLARHRDGRRPERSRDRRPTGRARASPLLEALANAFQCDGNGGGLSANHQSVLLDMPSDRLTVPNEGWSIHAGLPEGHDTLRLGEGWRFVPLASMRARTNAHSSTALATRGAPRG